MKTFKTVFVALAIFITSSAFTTNNPTTTGTPEKVTVEMTALLENPSFSVTQERTVMVDFVLNKGNEVFVLSVDCDDSDIFNFINQRLNRKTLQNKLEQGKVFTLPVKFVSLD
jgi:hypothetical protein